MTTAVRHVARRARRDAAPPHGDVWTGRAACHDRDLEPFFSDAAGTQQRMQTLCRGCPVRPACAADILRYEGDFYMRWGIFGGLTPLQRRALRCETLLGNVPNLEQAAELASPAWTSKLIPLRHRGLNPEEIAAEIRKKHGVIAAPVTVRVAVWWAGGKGSVLPRRWQGDRRRLWELVRDECRHIVDELRALDAGSRDIAAYLQVSELVLGQAAHAWRAEDAARAAKELEAAA